MPLNGDNCYLSVEGKDLQEIGKWTGYYCEKKNGHQGIICPFTGAFFHNMQTCLFVYIKQISGERLQDHWSSGLHFVALFG